MTWLLVLAFVAVILGILGVTVEGLFYLLVIGIALLVIDLVLFGLQLGRRKGKRPSR